MDKQEYIKKKLEERPKEWGAIARESGIARQTIVNVMGGMNTTMSTINKLYEHLKTLRKGKNK